VTWGFTHPTEDDGCINSDNEPCGSEESGGATPALRAWAESFSSPWRRCWQGLLKPFFPVVARLG